MKFKSLALIPVVFLTFSCNTSDKQIEEWVKKNPDKIMQSIMDHQKQEREKNAPKPEMVSQNADALFSESSPSFGSGPIKIAYFFDFNCGHCARQSETMKKVLAQEGKKVQIFYKNLAVLGPSSELSAKAALAAHQQKKFKEFYDELYQTKDKSMDSLKKIAKKVKLDVKKWEADINGEAVSKEMAATRAVASKMRIGGTPFVAIAPNRVFPGRVDQLLEIVKSM